MNVQLRDGHVYLPEEDFNTLLDAAAERGARKALASVGLEGPTAADDLRDIRAILQALRIARSTVWTTILRLVTTGLVLALLAGLAVRLHGLDTSP